MTKGLQVINLIQDIATPHNNVLISAIRERPDAKINVWYAKRGDQMLYPWSRDITDEQNPARIYGQRINLKFLRYCIANKHEKYVVVGWMNINTRLLHVLFFFLRRPFNHWTDLPDPKQHNISWAKRMARWSAYFLLKMSRCKVFAVGNENVNRLLAFGFQARNVINLPIFINVEEDLSRFKLYKSTIRKRCGVKDGGYLLVAGSRLVREKGYDLLIKAISLINESVRTRIKVVIVGNGEEEARLQMQIEESQLNGVIELMKWMEMEDFGALIASSDLFIHPARFDSYGTTILGMSLGVAVIGSKQAGAAYDRISDGVNGRLYDSSDTKTLAEIIEQLLGDEKGREQLASKGRDTALCWPPSRGAEILITNAI